MGSPSRVSGPNRIGLSRRGCTDEMIEALDRYRMGTGERGAAEWANDVSQ